MGIVSAVLGGGLGLLNNSKQRRADRRMSQQSHAQTLEAMTLGNQQDLANQKAMFDFRMERARGAGLTAVEAYGSPASGAGGGTTGSGSTLGNAASQQAIVDKQNAQARNTALTSKIIDATTALETTKMQTDSQQKVAETQAGATTGAATISAEANERIAKMVNELNTRELEEVALERLKLEQNVTEAEVKKLLNEANFTPEFKLKITKLTMGVSNSVNTMLQNRFGIDVASKEQMQSLSDDQMKNILHVFMAADSKLYSEIAGLLAAGSDTDEFNLDPITQATGEPASTLGVKNSKGHSRAGARFGK